ncbi:hypothetical protein [Hydrogenobacter hydrogenophilus]|uniref:CRISPR-associated protein (Cas_Cas02710) n=1 Tax=Hydrogenobacter hydrogenophilus TaxID=35835 RepID=A0A285P512_9AQUI|nr:hypothetical protein [Hydrogenobacter hydrogenophilus]SNZ16839.1 CRISPR-associated protein (Cas_Cas02710) [Hydrogenobacter hydrogenophilus]
MNIKSYKTFNALLGEFSKRDVFVITIFFGALPEAIFTLIDFIIKQEADTLLRAIFLFFVSAITFFYIWWRYKELKKFFEEREYEIRNANPSNAKVLITGLSIIPDLELEEVKKKGKPSRNFRLYPIMEKIKDLHEKAKLEKVIVIPSHESEKNFSTFKEIVEKLYKGVSVEKTEPVDYNHFDSIQRRIKEVFKKLREEGYKKSQIVVGITAGTTVFSVVASALTFFSDITLSYFTQGDEGKVVYIDIKGPGEE